MKTPGKYFHSNEVHNCDPKIFTYNCFGIDLKVHLDRFINSDCFLVTFLELIKGGLKKPIFRYNLVILKKCKGEKMTGLSFITGM